MTPPACAGPKAPRHQGLVPWRRDPPPRHAGCHVICFDRRPTLISLGQRTVDVALHKA